MTSEVSICNQALSLVGGELITALTDDTNEAKLCLLNYAPVRDAVLNEHDWTFATEWRELAPLADPPPGEYANAFPIPPEVISVLFVGLDYTRPTPQWQVESGNIRTDETTCKCQVLIRVEDPTRYPPIFVQALVARLAAELAIPLTESRQLAQDMFGVYRGKVSAAAARDTQQGRARRLRSRWLRDARYRDGTPWAGPYV